MDNVPMTEDQFAALSKQIDEVRKEILSAAAEHMKVLRGLTATLTRVAGKEQPPKA